MSTDPTWWERWSTAVVSVSGAAAVIASAFAWLRTRLRGHITSEVKAAVEPMAQRLEDIYVISKASREDTLMAEAQATTLLCSMGVGRITYDKAGKVISVNGAVSTLTGRDGDEFVGHGWINTVHPDDRERVIREWRWAVRDQRTSDIRYRWTKPDGTAVPVRARANPVLDGGVLIRWMCIVHPDTESP